MRDAPAFDFYPERWLAGVAMFSDAEQLAFLRLLCHQWLEQCLPDDLATLRRLGGKGVTPALLEKFPPSDDGFRRNPRLEIIRAEQRSRIAKKSEQRKAAADARWQKERIQKQCETDATASPRICETNAAGMPTTHHPPPTPVLLEKEPKAGAGFSQEAEEPDQNRQKRPLDAPTAPGGLKPPPLAEKAPDGGKESQAGAFELSSGQPNDFDLACQTSLPLGSPLVLLEAWADWQRYRQARHSQKPKTAAVLWTQQSARLAAQSLQRAASAFGPELAAARVSQAIQAGYKAFYFDGLRPHAPKSAQKFEIAR